MRSSIICEIIRSYQIDFIPSLRIPEITNRPTATKNPPTAVKSSWMAIALMTISSFHVLYAQEARPYSLWTVTILLSSWVLLRALRLKTQVSWGIYAVTLALGFYTHLYSLFVSIGHGIYPPFTNADWWQFTRRKAELVGLGAIQGMTVSIHLVGNVEGFSLVSRIYVVSLGCGKFSLKESDLADQRLMERGKNSLISASRYSSRDGYQS